MKPTKTKLLKREFADLLGCLPIVVSRLVKKGEVKTDINGRIDISSRKMQEYIENKRIEIQEHRERITKREIKIEKERELGKAKEEVCSEVGSRQEAIYSSKAKAKNSSKSKTNNQESKNNEKTFNPQLSTLNRNETSFHSVEYETKLHKLESEKHKSQLLEMQVKERKKELITLELLNRIITKTIGTLAKNIIEIPSSLVDEIIDIVKTEEEAKPLIVNLITKRLHKEIEETVDKTEREFTKL